MQSKKIRVLAACKDMGGSNILLPVVKSLRLNSFDVTLLGYEKSEEFFSKQGIEFNTIRDFSLEKADEASMAKLLSILKPSLVLLGTSWRESIEKPLAAAAKKQGIATVAVLDYWSNYRKRFLLEPDNNSQEDFEKYSPDYFLVMSEFARKEAIQEGFEESRVITVGQPYFDDLQKYGENFKQQGKNAFRKTMKISDDETTVLFLSQSLEEGFLSKKKSHSLEEMVLSKKNCEEKFGFCPTQVVNFLVEALKEISRENKKKFVFIIKTHPDEEKHEKAGEKELKYAELEKIKSPRVIIERGFNVRQLILESDFVLGMQSITMFEALVLGKPVLSIQPNLKTKDSLCFDGQQLIPAVYEKNLIKKTLASFLFEKEFSEMVEKSRGVFTKTLQIDGKATERIIDFMKNLPVQGEQKAAKGEF